MVGRYVMATSLRNQCKFLIISPLHSSKLFLQTIIIRHHLLIHHATHQIWFWKNGKKYNLNKLALNHCWNVYFFNEKCVKKFSYYNFSCSKQKRKRKLKIKEIIELFTDCINSWLQLVPFFFISMKVHFSLSLLEFGWLRVKKTPAQFCRLI